MPVDWAALIQSGAQIAGQAAAARAKGRADESTALNQRDQTANSLFNTAQNAQMQSGQLDLARQQFAENQASARAKQATVGDLLSRLQDVSINVPGIKSASVTGGIRPSAMGETGRLSNAVLAKQALMKQLEGDSFTGGGILTPPTQSAMPQANALDKILSGAGLAGSLAGAVGAAMGGQAPSGTGSGATSYIPQAGSEGAQLQGLSPELLKYLMGAQQPEARF